MRLLQRPPGVIAIADRLRYSSAVVLPEKIIAKGQLPMSETAGLLDTLPQVGRVTWIGLASHPGATIQPVSQVLARCQTGLDGDHHSTRQPGGNRQVTLIQAEHFQVVAALLARDAVLPEEVRRNIVVAGINLHALRLRRFRIGAALLEGTGDCVPCSKMERNLGPGGFNAMRGHGGITAKVLEDGLIELGSRVALVVDRE